MASRCVSAIYDPNTEISALGFDREDMLHMIYSMAYGNMTNTIQTSGYYVDRHV